MPARTAAELAEVTFEIDGGVSNEDEAYLREGVRLAQDFLLAEFGADVGAPVTVQALATGSTPPYVGEAVGGQITTYTSHPAWREQYPPLRRVEHAAHEYFHLMQEDLIGTRLDRAEAGPVWLVEGSAEYVGFLALASKGVVSYDGVRAYHQANVAFGPLLPLLEDLESRQAFYAAPQGSAYSLSALAVEILVAERGVGSLGDYFAGLGRSVAWDAAFADAFGQTPGDFYATLEGLRPGFSAVDTSDPFLGSLQRPAPPMVGAFDVGVTFVTSPVERGGQALLLAVTMPGGACTLDFSSANGTHLLTQETTADTRGIVFWLWSVRERLALGTAAVQVGCGGAPVSMGVELT